MDDDKGSDAGSGLAQEQSYGGGDYGSYSSYDAGAADSGTGSGLAFDAAPEASSSAGLGSFSSNDPAVIVSQLRSALSDGSSERLAAALADARNASLSDIQEAEEARQALRESALPLLSDALYAQYRDPAALKTYFDYLADNDISAPVVSEARPVVEAMQKIVSLVSLAKQKANPYIRLNTAIDLAEEHRLMSMEEVRQASDIKELLEQLHRGLQMKNSEVMSHALEQFKSYGVTEAALVKQASVLQEPLSVLLEDTANAMHTRNMDALASCLDRALVLGVRDRDDIMEAEGMLRHMLDLRVEVEAAMASGSVSELTKALEKAMPYLGNTDFYKEALVTREKMRDQAEEKIRLQFLGKLQQNEDTVQSIRSDMNNLKATLSLLQNDSRQCNCIVM